MDTEERAFGPFVLNIANGTLFRAGTAIAVGQRGLALLGALLESGVTVSKAELLEAAWPGIVVEEANLTVQIGLLRKALGHRDGGQEWIVTVPRVGYRLVGQGTSQGAHSNRKPSLAVLAFTSPDNDTGTYFADGIAEDLTTALSRFELFSVVSRSSAFVYKGRSVDIREVAKELGVRYVLEGTVRRAAGHVRVTASLLDAETGAHLWADRFDGELEDIFEFQDRITETVVGLIEPNIRLAEIERARRKRPENLDAYDLYLQALPLVYGMDPEGYAAAAVLLKRATALDPSFALAWAYAAWAIEKRLTMGLPSLGLDDKAECLRLARASLAVGANEPIVMAIAGWLSLAMADEAEIGLASLRRAVEANPNNLVVLNLAAAAEMLAGDLDVSLAHSRRAIRLSPNAPDVFWSFADEALVHLMKQNFEEAIAAARRSLATFNEWPLVYWPLIAAFAHLGRMDEAQTALQRLLVLAPHTTEATIRGTGPIDDGRSGVLFDGLRKAGLPSV